MDEVKILYATVHQLLGTAKEKTKELDKYTEKVLMSVDWDTARLLATEMKERAVMIARLVHRVSECADSFLTSGPYADMDPSITPLEAYALPQ